jgi:hypothetical protein
LHCWWLFRLLQFSITDENGKLQPLDRLDLLKAKLMLSGGTASSSLTSTTADHKLWESCKPAAAPRNSQPCRSQRLLPASFACCSTHQHPVAVNPAFLAVIARCKLK